MTLTLKTRLVLLLARLIGLDSMHRRMSVEQMRARTHRFARLAKKLDPRLAGIRNLSATGPGGDLPLRVYTPAGAGPFPLLMFFHGGGFVLCNLDSHDDLCRRLAIHTERVVVAVDYRLAPEHPFPAATDDCLAATRWAAENAASLNIDPARIAVTGDSAGGNLSAVTALRVRDEGGPALTAQVLLYPMTDHYDPGTPSLRENATGRLLTRDMAVWFMDCYLSDAAQINHPYACPLRAPDVSRVAPALVITAGFDPLRDEGELYAKRLQEAGVEVRLSRYERMIHGFMSVVDPLRESEPALREIGAWLKAH